MSDGNQLSPAGETACPTYFAKRLIQQGGAGGFACRSIGHNQWSAFKNKFPKTGGGALARLPQRSYESPSGTEVPRRLKPAPHLRPCAVRKCEVILARTLRVAPGTLRLATLFASAFAASSVAN